nr:amidohydrolase family protein [Alteromonas ponticola]
MKKAGMSLKMILDAATINGPRQFNMAADYGTIEQGKVANLLLLNTNPLTNVEAWQDIELVILRGSAVERNSLTVK